jgi:hypothetical protein
LSSAPIESDSIFSGSRLPITSSSNLPGFDPSALSSSSSSFWAGRADVIGRTVDFFAAPKILKDVFGAEDASGSILRYRKA